MSSYNITAVEVGHVNRKDVSVYFGISCMQLPNIPLYMT
jgi:hypothetical protein